MKYVAKGLLACGLLVYVASVFLPWFETSIIGGRVITYWSFKAEIFPYPYPHFHPPFQVMFWSWPSYWTAIFVFQILTLLFGLLTLLKKPKGKYESVFLGLTLLFSAVSIGTCFLQGVELSRAPFTDFRVGFWIASLAFLLLVGSLSVSLIYYIHLSGLGLRRNTVRFSYIGRDEDDFEF